MRPILLFYSEIRRWKPIFNGSLSVMGQWRHGSASPALEMWPVSIALKQGQQIFNLICIGYILKFDAAHGLYTIKRLVISYLLVISNWIPRALKGIWQSLNSVLPVKRIFRAAQLLGRTWIASRQKLDQVSPDHSLFSLLQAGFISMITYDFLQRRAVQRCVRLQSAVGFR